MEKEIFNEIIQSLQLRINFCKGFLGDIHSTEDLKNVTLKRAAAIKQLCTEEETIMTKICMVDLYHIIGMGQLSPTQMMKFTYLMQEYLSFRPTIKVLAQKLDSLTSIPTIPVKTRFKLLGLGDATLTYGEGELVDDASVEDYTATKQISLPDPPENLPFLVSGNLIEVDPQHADYFIQLMKIVFKVNLSTETLLRKVNNRGEYLGIIWSGTAVHPDTGKVMWAGTIKSNNTKQKITAYYNKNS